MTEIKAGEMLNLIEGDTELLEACGLDIVFDTISNVITAILAIYILLKMQIGMFFVVFFLQLIVIWSQLKFTNILVEKQKNKIKTRWDICFYATIFRKHYCCYIEQSKTALFL